MAKEKKDNNLHLRLDEVQEILTSVPHWMIRWGNVVIFSLILLFLALTWLIKYPDVIPGRLTLSTQEPPITVVARQEGMLQSLAFSDHQTVQKGDRIATVQSVLTPEAVNYLNELIAQSEAYLQTGSYNLPEAKDQKYTFGTIQNDYQNLITGLHDLNELQTSNLYPSKIQLLRKRLSGLRELSTIYQDQNKRLKAQEKREAERLKGSKTAFEGGFISQMDFYTEQKKYDDVLSNLETAELNAVNNQLQINNLQDQLLQLEFDYEQEQRMLEQRVKAAIEQIRNQVVAWGESHTLTSPIDGKLNYIKKRNEGQFVVPGEELFAIIPNSNAYIGLMEINAVGLGKVEVGQKVLIKFDKYPSHEFGNVEGEVTKVSLLPNENTYLLEVKLVNGLQTTYNKPIAYSPEMAGSAEVITEDLRLMERMFNQFKGLFD